VAPAAAEARRPPRLPVPLPRAPLPLPLPHGEADDEDSRDATGGIILPVSSRNLRLAAKQEVYEHRQEAATPDRASHVPLVQRRRQQHRRLQEK